VGINNDSPFPPEIEVESPWLKRELARTQAELDRHLADAAKRLVAEPAAQTAQAAWEQRVAPFLTSHADGWLAPAVAEARIAKDGKELPDRKPVISPMQTVAADAGKGASHQIWRRWAAWPLLDCPDLVAGTFSPQPRPRKFGRSR